VTHAGVSRGSGRVERGKGGWVSQVPEWGIRLTQPSIRLWRHATPNLTLDYSFAASFELEDGDQQERLAGLPASGIEIAKARRPTMRSSGVVFLKLMSRYRYAGSF
jgi:hypothetical protein